MKANEILNNIMVALGMESEAPAQTNFEQRKEAEGDVVFEAESFEAGQAVFILTEDGERMPTPEGQYSLEEDMVMKVDEQGMIAEIGQAQEEEKEEEPQAEAPAEEVEEVEASTEEVKQPKKIVESQVRETIFSAEDMDAVKVELEKVVSDFEAEKANWETEKTALSAEIEELKGRLAEEPAVEPMRHNVEGSAPKKVVFNQRSWKESTQERVYKRLYNK